MPKFEKKLAVWIADRQLHTDAKAAAEQAGISLSAYAERALRAALVAPPARAVKPPKLERAGFELPVSPAEIAAGLGAELITQFKTEHFGPPINSSLDVCRRCGHDKSLHRPSKKDPKQFVCQLALCNCARLLD